MAISIPSAITWSRDNWLNLAAPNVTAGAQYSSWIDCNAFNQMVCYVSFVLGGIDVGGGGYLRYFFQYSPNGTDVYGEEGIRSVAVTGELEDVSIYRELTATSAMRITFPVLDNWIRVGKTAADGAAGDLLTTQFYVHVRAG